MTNIQKLYSCVYTKLLTVSLIYQYVQLFIASKQNDYVKKIILGLSKTRIAISSLKYFMITIAMVILLTYIMTGQIELLYIGLASLMVLIFSAVISFRKLSEKYSQILKGDE
ncbi:membrane protein [Streptococcus iniae SF1]|nr:membrane protein [Streptococcus iniae SF1]